jgi:septum formation protein
MAHPENPLWRGTAPLLLASKSAARRALLEAAKLPFEILGVEIDERAIEAETPEDRPDGVARRLAREKALAGSRLRPDALVIGADQTLALGNESFHKPADRDAARAQLARLAGHTHALHSAVALARHGEIVFDTVEAAHLTMRPLESMSLDAYLDAAGDAVLGSVGGYQLEGLGIHLFERIEGAHSVILGLPLLPLLGFLRKESVLL